MCPESTPNPADAGAVPNWRSTRKLQYSITPRGRIRGRGRRREQLARRSFCSCRLLAPWSAKSGGTIILLPMVHVSADGETRRPIELLAFGMSTNQGVGAQLKEVAAIFKSEFSNHAIVLTVSALLRELA